MTNNRKVLPRRGVELFQHLESGGKSIFTRSDAEDILGLKPNYLNKFLHELESMGWVRRLEREKYLIIPLSAGESGHWSEHPFLIASYLVKPYAIAYWSALNHWHLTEQIVNTTFILTTSRKFASEKQIMGHAYKFVKVHEKKFFGLKTQWIENNKILVTDIEKTIVDCLDHPQYCGGIVEVAKAIKTGLIEKKISSEKILEYAEKLGNKAVYKRLGFILEVLNNQKEYLFDSINLNTGHIRQECKLRMSKGYSKLDPSTPKKGKHNSKWNIIENVGRNELMVD